MTAAPHPAPSTLPAARRRSSVGGGDEGDALLSAVRAVTADAAAASRRSRAALPLRALALALESPLAWCGALFLRLTRASPEALNDASLEHFFNRAVEFVVGLAVLLAHLRE